MTDLNPTIENTTILRLRETLGELRQQLENRFELHPDSSTENFRTYSASDSEIKASLNTFSGSEIDWLVHSWLLNPKSGYSHTHLLIWLGPRIWVPHLAFEMSTLPEILFYMDYIPRVDLSTELAYLDHYYQPVNSTYLALKSNPHLSPFISQTPYIRQVQSPTSLCYTSSATEAALDLIQTTAHEMLDRWLIWVNEAEPVPEAAQATLVQRDLFVRRTAVERDPGSKWLAPMVGQEFTDTFVRARWGGDSPMAQLH